MKTSVLSVNLSLFHWDLPSLCQYLTLTACVQPFFVRVQQAAVRNDHDSTNLTICPSTSPTGKYVKAHGPFHLAPASTLQAVSNTHTNTYTTGWSYM